MFFGVATVMLYRRPSSNRTQTSQLPLSESSSSSDCRNSILKVISRAVPRGTAHALGSLSHFDHLFHALRRRQSQLFDQKGDVDSEFLRLFSCAPGRWIPQFRFHSREFFRR